jgi:haloalkane dehalogenase
MNRPSNNELHLRSNYTEIDGHRIHYLDEGRGETILIVHGIPEWSMIYADLVKELSDTHRCIIPDHLGFGFSDKKHAADLSPKAHAARLLAFIDKLGLNNIHLVVHDFGGPIGMGALVQNPTLFTSLSISNTWLWNLQNTSEGKMLKMMQGALGKWLYLKYGFSVKFMAKNGFADKSVFNSVKYIFMQVHNTAADRFANYQLMLEMYNSGPWFDEVLSKLKKTNIPGEITWGMKDKFFTKEDHLTRWRKEFPAYGVKELATSGHFPQVESPKEMAGYIREFVKRNTKMPA